VAKVHPSDMRITIADTAGGLRIVMPCRRSWSVIVFLAFWICGWAVGEVMVSRQFLQGDAPAEGEFFMLTWLGVWTGGGVVAVYAWLWQVMGKEIVTVHGQTFTVRRDIGGVGFEKDYDLVQMRNLRGQPVGFSPVDLSSSFQLWGVGGMIAFDYGARTVRFGVGLDEAEVEHVLTSIKQRYRISETTSKK